MHQELKSQTELKELIENQPAVLAYFYSDKCAPCISLRPKVEDMVDKSFDKMELVFINSEKHPDITGSYGIFANPTLIIFLEGREYRRESKYISIPQLEETISRPYELMFD